MASSRKCARIPSHCRKLSNGDKGKAKVKCLKKNGESGAFVKAHYNSKKACSKEMETIKLLSAMRQANAIRKSASLKKKAASPKKKAPTRKRPASPSPTGPRKSGRTTKAPSRLIAA